MTVLAVVLLVFSALATLVWLSRNIMISVERRKGFVLSSTHKGPPENAPLISVIVAAKDEEENIGACVRTMLDQDYPNYEMFVANDRSGDRTGEIVQEIAKTDARLTVVNIERLPEGWCGKNNAMQTAIAKSRGEWIVMIDADTRQVSRRTLSVAMQYAAETKADLLSIFPKLEMKGFWENILQPVFSGIMIIWFHPYKVNDPQKAHAYANGAFMLIRRTAYEKIGTHEAIRQCLNEDMHMARLCKEKGLGIRVVRSGDLFTCRMYTSFMQMLRGWGRIYFGTFGTLRRLLGTAALVVIMSLLPYFTFAMGAAMAATGAGALWLAVGIAGAAATFTQISAVWRYYRMTGARADLVWAYPLGCLIALYTIGISLSRLRKGSRVTWRGTAYTAPQSIEAISGEKK